MTAPVPVLLAISMVSDRIVCVEECASTVAVSYDAEHDCPVVRHLRADCVCVTRPDGPEARSLAEFADFQIGRYVITGICGEPLPLNSFAPEPA